MASTYVNDLRLNEMATGDQSGSWGTVTNTNLELIAEAFSYGTEAITTNADTHTTTIADGATDPGRSMFLKYTGTLDSACTITIGPNTVSKLWFIENATSGSQNIIIKQGSGATVTIPSGTTKVIYSDGVGSGAKMVDAFASLDVGSISSVIMSATLMITGNTTISDNEIDVSSGNLTLDVAGDINLDADGANIRFLDGGTQIGKFTNASNDLEIHVSTLDKDIVFKGNDGGTTITALTLDLSEAGNAIFNNLIKTGNMSISGQEIDVSSGDLTLDVSGVIKLDADNSGTVYFQDAGTIYGVAEKASSDFVLRAGEQDGDIVFKGNDGGSGITALTIDMSDAGKATFNSSIISGGNITVGGTNNLIVNDSGAAIFGNDGDLSIGNSGVNGLISAPNGNLTLNASGNIGIGTSSPSRDLTVSSSGQTDIAIIAASGSSAQLCFGDGDDDNVGQIEYSHPTDSMRFYTQGAEKMRLESSGNLLVGMSSSSNTSAGFRVIPSDFMSFTTTSSDAGDRALMLNRQSSDGVIVEFKQANTTVGSVMSRSGASSTIVLDPRSNGVGITGTSNGLIPTNQSGTVTNNHVDLGDTNSRFRNGYFSGNLYGDGSNLTGVGGSTTAGAVGTYAFLYYRSATGGVSVGTSVSASGNLYYANTGSSGYTDSGTLPSGTWRLMGVVNQDNGSAVNDVAYKGSVFLRIS